MDGDVALHSVVGYPMLVPGVINQTSIEQHLQRTVDELFIQSIPNPNKVNHMKDRDVPRYIKVPLTYTREDRIKPRFFSTKSNYIMSRSGAGALGNIFENPLFLDGLKTDKSLVDMCYNNDNIFEYDGENECINNNDNLVNTIKYDDTKLQIRYGQLYDRVVKYAETEVPLVEAVALAEPLKIRVITKGPFAHGIVLKPLQHFMWSTLKNHPAFSLIGQPIDCTYVQDRLGAKLPEGEKYLSGDYSAATNKLAPWVSSCIANRIADILLLCDSERKMFLNSLVGHQIKVGDTFKPQMWGQLMGSITSFPILCIANAALCRAALEYDMDKEIRLRDCPLMINGDDVGMRCTQNCVNYWQDITARAGLVPSIGKCFFSTEFINMNSTNFMRLGESECDVVYCDKMIKGQLVSVKRCLQFQLVKYVNLGLVKGMARSSVMSNSDADNLHTSLGQSYREMLQFAPSNLYKSLHYAFMKNNNVKINKFHVPYYVPEWLGGLGLIGYKQPSKLDLRICNKILMDQHITSICSITDVPLYNVHKIVMSRLPVSVSRQTDPIGLESFRGLYASLCIETIFRNSFSEVFTQADCSTKKDFELLQSKNNSIVLHKLRSNERLWKTLLIKGHLPPPCQYETSYGDDGISVTPGILHESFSSYIPTFRIPTPPVADAIALLQLSESYIH
jgi:hypothetical protein